MRAAVRRIPDKATVASFRQPRDARAGRVRIPRALRSSAWRAGLRRFPAAAPLYSPTHREAGWACNVKCGTGIHFLALPPSRQVTWLTFPAAKTRCSFPPHQYLDLSCAVKIHCVQTSTTTPRDRTPGPATIPPHTNTATLLPIRKRPRRGFPRRHNQLPHQLPPPQQLLQHFFQRVGVTVIPLRRNLPIDFLEGRLLNPLHTRDPPLERLHSAHALIHAVPRIQPAQRRIRKIPFRRVKTESVVNHPRAITRSLPSPRSQLSHTPSRTGARAVARSVRLAKKYRLPPVGVASPFVEHQHPAKFRDVGHLAQLFIRKKIVHRHVRQISRIARTKLLARLAWGAPAPQLNYQILGVGDQLRPHLHHFRLCYRKPQPCRQPRTKQFVRQDPQALRVVLEFHHVIRLVRAAHQMRLRPATHSTHLFDRQSHPAPMLTANKPARQVNYFQTGNVPQRCTAPARAAACFESAQVRDSVAASKAARHEKEKQGSRATKRPRSREPNSATGTAPKNPPPRQKKRGTATPPTARPVPRPDSA